MSKTIEEAAQKFGNSKVWSCPASFIEGAKFMQKEYEEKLRWIPVHEKMPEQLTYIELKDSCDRIFSGSLSMHNEFRDRLHNDRLHFIVSWRSFL